MRTRDFDFELPEALIAQQPCAQRSASRLLHLVREQDTRRSTLIHRNFSELPSLLNKKDLLVFNDTRVIPARLYGHKATGGKVEVLVERLLDERRCLAHVRASKTPKPGTDILIHNTGDGDDLLHVEGRDDDLFVLRAQDAALADIMQRVGHMPLPPYITRQDEAIDVERYQTVYAKKPGAVAAPTAGLHFDEDTLSRLAERGIRSAFVTLHVGAGTFQPVRSEHIEAHRMHSEYLEVDDATVALCREARARGGRIIAVGTTSVRALETASAGGELAPFSGETDIFIYPGYTFRSVDAMITNFHLPESTLLMLVSAFAGRDTVLDAYREAVAQRYRFFSYGDAMLIE